MYYRKENQPPSAYSSLYFFLRPTKLKLGSHMNSGLMYHVYLNQATGAYLFLYFFNFLSDGYGCICELVLTVCYIFFVKDFSGTTTLRILKFGTNVGYDVVLCKRESASSSLSFPLFVHFSFSPIEFSVTDFLASMKARDFKFYIHLESG